MKRAIAKINVRIVMPQALNQKLVWIKNWKFLINKI